MLDLEVDYRRINGEVVVAEEYVSRFPEYGEVIEDVISTDTHRDTSVTIDETAEGSLVLGNYAVLEKIGEGGMGTVFKARHQRMERIVALKILSKILTNEPDAIQRFKREVIAAARLVHPNIVTAYDADESKGIHFLVMEYVDGEDLSSLVKQTGPMPTNEAVLCVIQAGIALAYAHGQGVVHRDVKPANLLLDGSGTVKVLDMGLARLDVDAAHDASLTNSGAALGTIDYMSPEQAADSKNVDARTDIYSLGITLWYLITGKATYEAKALIGKVLAHREHPIPSLVEACDDVSPELDAVFRKMVAKQADDRFGTMQEAVDALQSCLGDKAQVPDSPTSGVGPPAAVISQTERTTAFEATVDLSNPAIETAATVDVTPTTHPVPRKDRIRNVAIGVGLVALLFSILTVVNDRISVDVNEQHPEDVGLAQEPGSQAFPNNVASADTSTSRPPVAPGDRQAFSLEFDELDDWMKAEFEHKMRTPLTIEMWVKPEVKPPLDTGNGGYEGHGYLVNYQGVHLLRFETTDVDGVVGPRWEFKFGLSGPDSPKLTTPKPIELHRWSHVATVFDGKTVRLFVNGEQVASEVSPRLPRREKGDLFSIGGRGDRQAVLGEVREIRVSTVARYEVGFKPEVWHESDADTLVLFHCDEGEGKKLFNTSRHKFEAKLSGIEWIKVSPSELEAMRTIADSQAP